MKKFLLLISSLCFIAAMLIIGGTTGGESGTNSSDTVTNDQNNDQNVINIGVFEPLTGDDAQEGLQETLALRYANSICPSVEINGVHYDINLIEQDNSSDIYSAGDSASSLADSGVSAVLGSYGSWMTEEGEKVFAKKNIPLVGITSSSRLITNDSKNFFRVCYSDSFQSGAISSYAFSLNCRNAAILSQTGNMFSKDTGKLIADEFSKAGGNSTSYNYQKDQQNFKSLVAEIKNSGVDCIIMDSGPDEARYFISQARELGLNCPIFGLESWDTASFLNSSSSYGEVYVSSEYSEDSADTVCSKFASDYSSWLKSDSSRIAANGGFEYVSPSAALAYDSYMLVVKAIKTTKAATPKEVSKALKNITYSGLTGNISFGNNGESKKVFAFIKKLDPQNEKFNVLLSSSSGQ